MRPANRHQVIKGSEVKREVLRRWGSVYSVSGSTRRMRASRDLSRRFSHIVLQQFINRKGVRS